MKRFIAVVALSLITIATFAQTDKKIKYYSLAGSGTSTTINLASDADIILFSGTRTLGHDYTITTTGTPVDGQTLFIMWDGSAVSAAGGYVVNLPGSETLNEKQAESKVIVLSVYKGGAAAWDTRVLWDSKTTSWVGVSDVDTSLADNKTMEIDPTAGIQLKDGGITNAKIASGAAIAKSKLDITHAIDSGDISLTANIPWKKMLPLTAGYVPYTDANGFLAASSTTSTQLGYLVGVTSAIQTQLNAKTTSGAIVNSDVNASAAIAYSKLNLTGTVVNADISAACSLAMNKLYPLTASKALASDGSGVVTATSVTATELGYLSGVTSNVQTQINTARSGKTYTRTAASPLVLTSAATDVYLLLTSTSQQLVTLPDAADFASGKILEFTRIATDGDSSVVIQPHSANYIIGSENTSLSNFTIPKESKGGYGIAFIGNGTDTWYYLKEWGPQNLP